MLRNSKILFWCLSIAVLMPLEAEGQLSPGELSQPHSHLSGMSNCTQCHVLGNKVSGDKCLACHTEIKSRINIQKGYHSSAEVIGKQCSECHSEHNGRNFRLVRLDETTFNHNSTGYALSTPHAKQECRICHAPKNIKDQSLKSRKNTFLGVGTECLTCHTDYHFRTLSSECVNCHNQDSFVPATGFSHDKSRFILAGKHKSVDCSKCHEVRIIDGRKFQQFRGIQFSNCTSCHKDPHMNQFGQTCRQCHSEESFHIIKGMKDFDHDKTGFRLEEKHQIVTCKSCHKNNYTEPLKHDRCSDCHTDYHNRQFLKNGVSPDCSECHTIKGFANFSFTVERHNTGPFPLRGAHGAIPCYECHRKQDRWSFRSIGIECKDCHQDIHQSYIREEFYPGGSCRQCHTETRWTDVTFNHSTTNFKLTGAHSNQKCSDCHFRKNDEGIVKQKFNGLSTQCSDCHMDIHSGQFAASGKTDCAYCHETDNWEASRFNHDNTAFRLDGKHKDVPCSECHKRIGNGTATFINYKLKEFKCESCHF